MRFGIMNMQMSALVPPGLTAGGAVAYLAGFDHAALTAGLVEQGFKLIELGGDLTLFFPQAYAPATIEKLARLKEEKGLSYTVHLPLWSVEASTPLTPVREGSVRAVVEVVKATLPLKPESYVLHATGALAAEFYRMRIPENARALLLKLFQQGAAQSIKTLLAETGLPSRKLAIETIEFPLELTLELAYGLDTSICLDTGHILAGFAGYVPFFEALEKILPRLGQIHLHDCPQAVPGGELGYGKDHTPLGSGDLDTARLLRRLQDAGWDGPIIFELMVEEALQSLEVVRKLGFQAD
jgi:sugar phosphate isomerase/epimerase